MASKDNKRSMLIKLCTIVMLLVATILISYKSYELYTYKYQFKLNQNDYGKGYFEVKNTKITKEVLQLLSKRTNLPNGSSRIFYLNKDSESSREKYTPFMEAKKGDYLVAFKDSGIEFIFRPTENKLINVAPYQNDSNKGIGCSTWCLKFEEY